MPPSAAVAAAAVHDHKLCPSGELEGPGGGQQGPPMVVPQVVVGVVVVAAAPDAEAPGPARRKSRSRAAGVARVRAGGGRMM